MGGRPPIPIDTHRLNHPKLYGDLALRSKLEPQSNLEPRCPGNLTREEKKAWRYYKVILKEYGLFKVANAPLLEMISKLHAECVEFHEKSKGKPVIQKKTPKGEVLGFQMNPLWVARHRNEEKILTILRELGLSSLGMAKIGSLAVRRRKEADEFFED